jgi:hypothetical protein
MTLVAEEQLLSLLDTIVMEGLFAAQDLTSASAFLLQPPFSAG